MAAPPGDAAHEHMEALFDSEAFDAVSFVNGLFPTGTRACALREWTGQGLTGVRVPHGARRSSPR